MKLAPGGSLTNVIYSQMTKGQPKPEVGMGATILMYSDRKACTIIKVWETRGSGNRGQHTIINYVEVQEDTATRTDDGGPYSEMQKYDYTPNPHGAKSVFRFGASKQWKQLYLDDKGRYRSVEDGNGLRIGERREYVDPNF